MSEEHTMKWVVTDVSGETILHSSPIISGRILDFWKGTNRLRRMNARGDLRDLSDVEYEQATKAAHPQRTQTTDPKDTAT